jgi:hypothetical protein
LQIRSLKAEILLGLNRFDDAKEALSEAFKLEIEPIEVMVSDINNKAYCYFIAAKIELTLGK